MTIHVIGIGLDGAAGLNLSTRQIVETATLLVGSDRHLNYFPNLRAQRFVLGNFIDAIAEIKRHLTYPNSSIIVLVSGDPLFFGLGRLLVKELPWEELQFYPHISSVQLAFNRLKVPWQDAKVISVHGRATDELIKSLQQGVEKIAVLTDDKNTPAAIARLLLALDNNSNYQFWVCQNLGGAEEKVELWSPETLQQQTFSPLNIVVLLRESNVANGRPLDLGNLPLLGLPDSSFLTYDDRPSLMTKREVRLLALGELALQSGQVIWDIGAGSGSVSIEVARLFPDSVVYAIEKSAAGSTLIEENCRRFQVSNVISVNGSAPGILHRLRPPDRVFVGGSGGQVQEILSACAMSFSRRLSGENGRKNREKRIFAKSVIVLTFATWEHLSAAVAWVEDRKNGDRASFSGSVRGEKFPENWNYRLLQVQLSRSVPVAELTRFAPLNPVTIMTINYKS